MQAPVQRRAPRQGHIQLLVLQRVDQRSLAGCLRFFFIALLQGGLDLVGELPDLRALVLARFRQALKDLHDRGGFAQVFRLPFGQVGLNCQGSQFFFGFGLQRFQFLDQNTFFTHSCSFI